MKKQSLVLVVIAAIVVIAGIFFITNQNIQKDVSDDQKKIGLANNSNTILIVLLLRARIRVVAKF